MNYGLYVVTDDRISNGRSHVEVAELSYRGGADIVQLRVKDGDPRFLDWAKRISDISRSYGRVFIVNDDVRIAVESGADGVHIGQSDMPVEKVKEMVPPGFVIGVSVGNVEEAVRAENEGATYVALSPIFDTASKDDAGYGHGMEVLKSIRAAVTIPLVAIGGININNAGGIIEAGADGVAVISAVVSQPDIADAARRMKEIITASKVRR